MLTRDGTTADLSRETIHSQSRVSGAVHLNNPIMAFPLFLVLLDRLLGFVCLVTTGFVADRQIM